MTPVLRQLRLGFNVGLISCQIAFCLLLFLFPGEVELGKQQK